MKFKYRFFINGVSLSVSILAYILYMFPIANYFKNNILDLILGIVLGLIISEICFTLLIYRELLIKNNIKYKNIKLEEFK